MPLKLENEFVVAAAVDDVWSALLDLERVATCLPGATIERGEEPDTFRGAMRVKLGPVSMSYQGTAKLGSVDTDAHTAVFTVGGTETRGQGTASATITNRLLDEDGATRVVVETELTVTGRAAQFGRGIMQDVAASMLDDFSSCLSRKLGDTAPTADVSAPARAAPAAPADPPPLKLGGTLARALLERLRRLFGRPRRG